MAPCFVASSLVTTKRTFDEDTWHIFDCGTICTFLCIVGWFPPERPPRWLDISHSIGSRPPYRVPPDMKSLLQNFWKVIS